MKGKRGPHTLRADDLPALAEAWDGRVNGSGLRAPCPLPEHPGDGSRKDSVSVRIIDGGRLSFTCHSGGKGSGNGVCVSARLREQAVNDLLAAGHTFNGNRPRGEYTPPPPDPLPSEQHWQEWRETLRAPNVGMPNTVLEDLGRCGWAGHEGALVDRLGVGHDGARFRFPIHDRNGELVNVVKYNPGAQPEHKMRAERGRPRDLFPAPEGINGEIVFVFEGEPDAITATLAGLPAVGVPGMNGWRSEWVKRFMAHTVVVSLDCKDDARERARKVVAELTAAGIRAVQIDLAPERQDGHDFKGYAYVNGLDAAAAHVRALALEALVSVPPATHATVQRSPAPSDATVNGGATVNGECNGPVRPDLALQSQILPHMAEALRRCSVVGEQEITELIYLAVTSRLLHEPLSIAVTGPSSGGKSWVVKRTLALFPPDAYIARTSMSPKALVYSDEPLAHRMLVVYELAAIGGEWDYFIRTLLSEGHICHEVTEKVNGRQVTRLIMREGPTGLIVTTTAAALYDENATRMQTVTVNDTREQTESVMKQQAAGAMKNVSGAPDLSEWHDLQRWLSEEGPHEVVIPFADQLAKKIPPVATRLRRDFPALLTLIQAHALLHRANRTIDERGYIVATVQDYAVVRKLISRVMADAAQSTVSKTVRETVEAVTRLYAANDMKPVKLSELAAALDIDKSAASRRVKSAGKDDYIVNLEDREGKPARLKPDVPLPADVPLLPDPSEISIPRRRPGVPVRNTRPE